MLDTEKVIKGLEYCNVYFNCCDKCPYWDCGMDCMSDLASEVLALLKGQEESIPVSWLTEKLEGHPELPYAVTDGINNVLDLWECR